MKNLRNSVNGRMPIRPFYLSNQDGGPSKKTLSRMNELKLSFQRNRNSKSIHIRHTKAGAYTFQRVIQHKTLHPMKLLPLNVTASSLVSDISAIYKPMITFNRWCSARSCYVHALADLVRYLVIRSSCIHIIIIIIISCSNSNTCSNARSPVINMASRRLQWHPAAAAAATHSRASYYMGVDRTDDCSLLLY